MGGMGPAPKDPSKRARRNKDAIQLRVIDITPADKPELPEFSIAVTGKGDLVSETFQWPAMTREWWTMLDHHPLVNEFTELDWMYLLETARVHASFWMGDIGVASELRLREGKYGFTPEDRARLRWQLALAVEAEVTATVKVQAARDRMRGRQIRAELPAPDDDAMEA
jgi:hypothetical protein